MIGFGPIKPFLRASAGIFAHFPAKIRIPEQQFSCMSAYCIYVKKLADLCGMEYDCGRGLVAFFSMYVFGEEEPT